MPYLFLTPTGRNTLTFPCCAWILDSTQHGPLPGTGLNAQEKTAIVRNLTIYNPQSQNKPDDNVTDESQTRYPTTAATKDEIWPNKSDGKLQHIGSCRSVSTRIRCSSLHITSPSGIPAFLRPEAQ